MITTLFARILRVRVSMPFVNAIVTLSLVSSNLSTFTIPNFMHSMDFKTRKTALSSQKMFTVAKKPKWIAAGSILIGYHTMRTNTFAAMDVLLLQMNVNNLLSISKFNVDYN